MAMNVEIPEVVVERLPIYARALADLNRHGQIVVSSRELGALLGITPTQIRKDLSYFGRFGKQGRGYDVRWLLDQLRQILGLDRRWTMALVGVGQLGRAILGYGGFAREGYIITQAFDADNDIIGLNVGGIVVQDVGDLANSLRITPADIGIVAVPASSAIEVINALVKSGVMSILNYAPITTPAPPGVHIKNIDPVLALQSMTFHLKRNSGGRK